MSLANNTYRTVTVETLVLVNRTERAILVRDENDHEVWISNGLVRDTDLRRIADRGFVDVPYWLAKKEGWA